MDNLTNKEEKDLRFKELTNSLKSKDEASLSKILKEIETQDDVRLIKPLIELGKRNKNEAVNIQISQLLFDLKLTKGHDIILNELENMEANPFRSVLISTIWNANIAAMDHLEMLVRLAIEGDFLEAIECLTVIEETEGVIEEEQVLESLIMLKEYLSNPENKDSDKTTIIQDILLKVEEIEQMHQ
jgi:hypothetical protein